MGLVVLSMSASGLGLIFPKLVARSIDAFVAHAFSSHTFIVEFVVVMVGIFVCTYLQGIMQTIVSERVARDIRNTLAKKISQQSYAFVERVTPAKLLTNLTSDIDSMKLFVGQAISTLVSSLIVVLGAAVLLLTINWKLALAVIGIIPIVAGLFSVIFGRARVLIKKSREVIDWLNKVINESVLGAALIRVLHSQVIEVTKFTQANEQAKQLGFRIVTMFATLIPAITFVANLAALVILLLGGHFVLGGTMTLGDFSAFTSYLALLIFPLILTGVMSSVIAQSQASYDRIREVLEAPEEVATGTRVHDLIGRIEFEHVNVAYGDKNALTDISFTIQPGTKTAIIGPTAAGKTQILHLLTRLISPTSGVIKIDGEPIDVYDAPALHRQIGFVFQDSIIFNLTLRDNIAFGGVTNEEDLDRAIRTAELTDFIASLPNGLETVISERGSVLSGGQKQRIMLARALALHPKMLLLDDFTARVDTKTEQKILSNLAANYPGLTLVSVTQKIAPVESYDKIILLMEGEMVASGTHVELLAQSPEYAQIYDSQKSTSQYE